MNLLESVLILFRQHLVKKIGCTVFLLFLIPGNVSGEVSDPVREILMLGIEANFSGNYDLASETFEKIGTVAPVHPAREFYQAVVLFWRNSTDPGNPRYVPQIREYLKISIEKADAWLSRDNQSVDALHYLGLSYTYLGRLEAHCGNLYTGGVYGEKGRKYLERGIEICSNPVHADTESRMKNRCSPCEDLYFPYGAYSYFAGRLPRLLRFLNFFWFIPSGSKEEGLSALERSARSSCLHELGTKSLLTSIYLIFEEEHADQALVLSKELMEKFPHNPYLDLQHAKILVRVSRYPEASAWADLVLTKFVQKKSNYDDTVQQGALLVKAEVALRRGRLESAEVMLSQLNDNPVFQNNTLTAEITLLQGMLSDIKKERTKAIRYYDQVKSYKGNMQNRVAAGKASRFLEEPFSIEQDR
ncbi:MAG: hypothetical protein R6X10_00475 [Desulfobacterales bacterium]